MHTFKRLAHGSLAVAVVGALATLVGAGVKFF